MLAGELVIWTAAVVTAIGVLWRQVVRPAYRWLHRMGQMIEFVGGQMQNNGGSTLRDGVDRLDQRTASMDERLTAVEDHIRSANG